MTVNFFGPDWVYQQASAEKVYGQDVTPNPKLFDAEGRPDFDDQ